MGTGVTVCEKCGQRMHGEVTACLRCNGSIKPWSPKPARQSQFDRSRFLQRRQLCLDCSQWGEHEHEGRKVLGCGSLVRPCDAEKRWTWDSPHWCPRGYEAGRELVVLIEMDDEELPKPTSDLAIVTHATGDVYERVRRFSRDRVERYAGRCGADLIELSGNLFPDWILANKFRAARVARNYRKTLWLDVDVIVSDDAPSIFEAIPEGEFAIYDEIVCSQHEGEKGWAQEQTRMVCESQRIEYQDLPWSGNGGILLIPNELASLYDPPTRPLPSHWCAEQQLLTARLIDQKAPVHLMDWRWNCLRTGRYWDRRSEAYFVHFNGVFGGKLIKEMEAYCAGELRAADRPVHAVQELQQ